MDQKRIAPRNRVLKAGIIEFNGGGIDCIVRNVSRTGAALDVASPVGIPRDFTLIVPADGLRKRCRLIWLRESRIGVAFEEIASLGAA